MPIKTNEEQFLEMLQIADPELYQLKVALAIAHLNPMILIPIIKTLGNLMLGSGHGELRIQMFARIIKSVTSEEKIKVEQKADA